MLCLLRFGLSVGSGFMVVRRPGRARDRACKRVRVCVYARVRVFRIRHTIAGLRHTAKTQDVCGRTTPVCVCACAFASVCVCVYARVRVILAARRNEGPGVSLGGRQLEVDTALTGEGARSLVVRFECT